jgi:hypothetical protein
MTLDKTQYSLAENMTITFYLRNISNDTVTLTIPTMEGPPLVTAAEGVTIPGSQYLLNQLDDFGLTIANMNGTALSIMGQGSGVQSDYSLVLEPNASLNQTDLIDTRYLTYNQNGQFFQPGAYQIAAVLFTEQFIWKTPSIAFTLG